MLVLSNNQIIITKSKEYDQISLLDYEKRDIAVMLFYLLVICATADSVLSAPIPDKILQ